jgi:ABC-type polysaccharide/polyol phosphate export permease
MHDAAVFRHRTRSGTTYGDEPTRIGPSTRLARFVREVRQHEHALLVFTLGRFQATYRAQALGLLWPMANPTILMIVMSVFFGIAFPNEVQAYPVFLMLGLVPWHFLSHAWTDGTTCFLHHSEVIKRTSVPAYVVATGTVFSHVFNLGFAALSLLPLIAFYPESFHVSLALVVLPLVIVFLVALGLGLALISAVLNVVFRDVGYIVNSALVVLFWATPIAYPIDRLPGGWKQAMLLNPMASLIHCIRDVILKGVFPPASVLSAAAASTLGVLLLAVLIYRRFETEIADHV